MLTSFYRTVLPGTGQYCLFQLSNQKHVWAPTIDALVELTEARSEKQGIYFATAGFGDMTKTADDGTVSVVRAQANVLALRSLRMDIDAGPEKAAKIEARIAAGKLPATARDTIYATQRDAVAGLVGFAKSTRMAPSYIVSSGAGLHVYYALEQDLPPAEWLPMATRLGELAKELGLRVDTTCTIDTARILRPIGMLHPNGSRVAVLKATGKVYAPGEITELLGVTEETLATVAPAARRFDMSINADMALPPGPPKSLAKIVANCGAMNEVATSKGDVSEPHWRAMLGIVKFTVEGLDAAHELSCGHAEYNPRDTEKKFNAWAAGPTSCVEFAKHTTACSACPHQGKIKSPVMVGQMTREQVAELPEPVQEAIQAAAVASAPVPAPTGDPWDGLLPPKFLVTHSNGQYTMVHSTETDKKDPTGATIMVPIMVPFSHTVFWLTHWSESESAEDVAHAIVSRFDPKDGVVRSFPLQQGLVSNRAKLLEKLGDQGIQLSTHSKAVTSLDHYLKSQLLRIQMLDRRPKISDRFGMRILPTGELICAHGENVIFPDGRIMEGMLSRQLRDMKDLFPIRALPTSDLGEWDPTVWDDHIRPAARRHSAFLAKHYGPANRSKYSLAIMLGLASPLMPFVEGSYHAGNKLPPNGLSVSLFARKGGEGKTTAVKAALLAFGDIAALVKDAGKNGATDIARLVKLSVSGTMPVSMEEMGNAKEQSIAELISSVANGSGRERGTKAGGMTSAATWALINLITTNRSQRDMVSASVQESAAIQNRLLELNVEGVTFTVAERDSYVADFAGISRDCAGSLGAVINYAACRMGVAKMNALVTACATRASKELGAVQDARYQYRALGALMATHMLLASEGMAPFALKDLVDEFRAAHDAGKTFVQENVLPTDGLELLQIMLSEMHAVTLITQQETNRGVQKDRYDLPLNARVPDDPAARHIVDQGRTYVSAQRLRDWCLAKKVSEREMLADAKAAGVLLPPVRSRPASFTSQIDLFKGTREERATATRCFKIDTHKLRLMTDGGNAGTVDLTNVLPLHPQTQGDEPGDAPTQEATA